MRRALPLLLSVVALAAVAWPALGDPSDDSYPLSTYPMFARARPAEAWFSTAVGIDPAGADRRLSSTMIGGTAEPVHAAVTVQRAIDTGTAQALCAEIARRIGGDGSDAAVARVEVVRLRVDLDRWYGADGSDGQIGGAAVLERDVAATCAVPPAVRPAGHTS